MDLRLIACLCALVAYSSADDIIRQCEDKSIEGLTTNVHLKPCKRSPCKLKKGTKQHIEIKFTPEKELSVVTNKVQAQLLGVWLPFVGVDGASICSKLQTEAGEKAQCPLKAGTTYVYKDSFDVLNFYPTIETKVHWALQDQGKDIICFEVPVKISA